MFAIALRYIYRGMHFKIQFRNDNKRLNLCANTMAARAIVPKLSFSSHWIIFVSAPSNHLLFSVGYRFFSPPAFFWLLLI